MSVYPCVDGLPAATELVALQSASWPLVWSRGAGKTFSGAYAGLFVVPGTVAMRCGVPVAQSCPHRSA